MARLGAPANFSNIPLFNLYYKITGYFMGFLFLSACLCKVMFGFVQCAATKNHSSRVLSKYCERGNFTITGGEQLLYSVSGSDRTMLLLLPLLAAAWFIPSCIWREHAGRLLRNVEWDKERIVRDYEYRLSVRRMVEGYLLSQLNKSRRIAKCYLICMAVSAAILTWEFYYFGSLMRGKIFDYGISKMRALIVAGPDPEMFATTIECDFGGLTDADPVVMQCFVPGNLLYSQTFALLSVCLDAVACLTVVQLLRSLSIMLARSRFGDKLLHLNRTPKLASLCNYGDFFLMDMIARHMDPALFIAVVWNMELYLSHVQDVEVE